MLIFHKEKFGALSEKKYEKIRNIEILDVFRRKKSWDSPLILNRNISNLSLKISLGL